jgi:hypothetical protein
MLRYFPDYMNPVITCYMHLIACNLLLTVTWRYDVILTKLIRIKWRGDLRYFIWNSQIDGVYVVATEYYTRLRSGDRNDIRIRRDYWGSQWHLFSGDRVKTMLRSGDRNDIRIIRDYWGSQWHLVSFNRRLYFEQPYVGPTILGCGKI